jgi:hypothetical protein
MRTPEQRFCSIQGARDGVNARRSITMARAHKKTGDRSPVLI